MINKPIKVNRNGKYTEVLYLTNQDKSRSRSKWYQKLLDWSVMWVKRITWLSVASAGVYGILLLGGVIYPKYKTVEAIVEVETVSPVLQRIAGCESQGSAKLKGTHFDKNGQVLMRSNTNKTVDLGKYQINTVWFAKATELGIDLTTEEGNEQMAMWIYKNRGTGDWSASANCWKK